MKDQYFGDVNDFVKYALLRALTVRHGLSLGVCWMLTPSDGGTDGKHLSYLAQSPSFRCRDPGLFDFLRTAVIDRRERRTASIEQSGLLGDVRFQSAILSDDASARAAYFAQCDSVLHGRDLIFFDPDNGLEVQSTRRGQRGSSKYIYWDEGVAAYASGSSVLVYQHFPRQPREIFSSRLMIEMRERTRASVVMAVRTSHVLFLLAAQERHAEAFARSLSDLQGAWHGLVSCHAHAPSGSQA